MEGIFRWVYLCSIDVVVFDCLSLKGLSANYFSFELRGGKLSSWTARGGADGVCGGGVECTAGEGGAVRISMLAACRACFSFRWKGKPPQGVRRLSWRNLGPLNQLW